MSNEQTPLTAEQMHALGCEIIAGMHAEIRGGDMEYGRAAQQADLQLPSAEELATEGYTEVPEWAHKTVEHNRQRLSKQAAFISEVAIKKIMELSPDVFKAAQLRQELEYWKEKHLKEEKERVNNVEEFGKARLKCIQELEQVKAERDALAKLWE